jgi:predicted RNA-binding protein YlqC (UPF0109 family)
MVDKPEDVSVEVVPMPGGVVLRYLVAPSDVGKLIGAQGRNARSLRVIVAAIGMGAELSTTGRPHADRVPRHRRHTDRVRRHGYID